MTLFERIEKKIFFKIVRTITFFVAFIALVVTIAGMYTSFNSSMDHEADAVKVSKEEIQDVMRSESKSTSNAANESAEGVKAIEKTELEQVAESIAKKILAAQDIKPGSDGYATQLGEVTDQVTNTMDQYDEEVQLDALKQLDSLSNSFKKENFIVQTNAFLALYKSKYGHERALAEQKNAANAANKMMAYSAVGAGIVTFALFVMILVLLRIEKNTRDQSESDEYDGTDKKLLFTIVGAGIVIALLLGWAVKEQFTSNEEFDPVSEVRTNNPDLVSKNETQTAVIQETAVPAIEVNSEDAAPAAEVAAEPANNGANQECYDTEGNWICE